jgi:hypothetical protein
VINAEKIAKFHLNLQEINLFIAVSVLKAKEMEEEAFLVEIVVQVAE